MGLGSYGGLGRVVSRLLLLLCWYSIERMGRERRFGNILWGVFEKTLAVSK
jgi:hypothetical protein